MQPKQNMAISGENDNISENFGPHEDKKSTLEEQDIKKDYTNLVGKSSDTRSRARDGLSGYTLQDRLFASKSSSSLKEVRFCELAFSASKHISDTKYHYLGFQNNYFFHLFNDQLDYVLVTHFAEFKTTKGNIDRFLCNLLMAPLTEKLSYRNVDK